jgi:phosphatidylinositol 4-kinase
METWVFVWTWLVSVASYAGSLVLAELIDAWSWTMDTKHGLFLFASGTENSGLTAKL